MQRAASRTPPAGMELCAPGVLDVGAPVDADESPVCPALEVLLHAAKQEPCADDLTEHLCARFGVTAQESDLPLGALMSAASGDRPGNRDFALLAAVHLHVDRDRAYVVPLESEVVSESESDALQALLGEQLAALECRLLRENSALWVVELSKPLRLRTVSLAQARGRNAQTCLPQGADARQWLTHANELQMLLHAHPLNERRQQAGMLPINSVWLWGVGAVPGSIGQPFGAIYTELGYLRGLAALGGVPCEPVPERFEVTGDAGFHNHRVCVSLSRGHNPPQADWTSLVERLERDWFAPTLEALRRRALAQVSLWLGGQRIYHVNNRVSRFRWRKPSALRQYLPAGQR